MHSPLFPKPNQLFGTMLQHNFIRSKPKTKAIAPFFAGTSDRLR
jgi:hypothetical protein